MNPMVERKKKSRGRQKIQIKRIEKEEARQVCFSKRRNGLFKKASELCILCGAQVAIVVFSPSGKPFTYGHPSDDDVFRRFLTGSGVVPSEASSAAELSADLNAEMMHLTHRLDAENQRRSLLEAGLGAPWPAQKPFWWDADVNSMGMEELREYHLVLQELHAVITRRPPVEVELSSPLQQSDQTTDDELFQEIWDDYFLQESIFSSVQVGLSPPPHQQECVDDWTTGDELPTFQVGLSPPVQAGLLPTPPQHPDQWTPGDELPTFQAGLSPTPPQHPDHWTPGDELPTFQVGLSPPVQAGLSQTPSQHPDQWTPGDELPTFQVGLSVPVQAGLSPTPPQHPDQGTPGDELPTFQVGLSPPVQTELSLTPPQQPDQWTPGDDLFEELWDISTDDYDFSEFCYDL